MKRLPILPTLVVFAACLTMVALGVWQLQRSAWKEGLIAAASTRKAAPPIPFPNIAATDPVEPHLLRPVAEECRAVKGWRSVSGQNARGEAGWVHIATCVISGHAGEMQVDIGWSRDPAQPAWQGGGVSGLLTTDRESRLRLVARTAAPGLVPSRQPSPSDLPNNHFAYAIQWFLFAAIAALIYMLAAGRRLVRKADQAESGQSGIETEQ